MTVQKIRSGRIGTIEADEYVGDIGTIFYNEALGDLRLSDGRTVGGIPLSAGGGDGINLGAIPRSIIPYIDVELDLGSPDKRWRDLYLSSNSLYLGTNKVEIVDGELTVNDTPVVTVANLPTILPTATTTNAGAVKVDGTTITIVDGVITAQVGSAITVSEIDGFGTKTNEVVAVTAIRFDKDTGFNVENLGSGEVKVSLGSTFKTWLVEGQQDLIAVGEDTIRLVASNGIILTTDPAAEIKTLTISVDSSNISAGSIAGSPIAVNENLANGEALIYQNGEWTNGPTMYWASKNW